MAEMRSSLIILAVIYQLKACYGFRMGQEDLDKGMAAARKEESRRKDIETLLLGFEPFPDSADDKEQRLLKPSPTSQHDDTSAEFVLLITESICKRKKCRFHDLQRLFRFELPQRLRKACHKKPKCKDRQKYRSFDGTCNNLKNPLLGSAQTAQNRLTYADYDDLIQKPRTSSIFGRGLASAREISDTVMTDIPSFESKATTTLIFFGQLLAHDIVLTPNVRANGSQIVCCEDALMGFPKHPACFPISIAEDDNFYSRFKRTCMEFVRSGATVNSDCKYSAREQENQISSFIDASFLYGSGKKNADHLREKKNGLLRQQKDELLPELTSTGCDIHRNCPFAAGDTRVNENPGLAIHNTMFSREHNRIATKMIRMKPHWNDEKVYQETRKIVIAFLQNIAYNEFLPVVLGDSLIEKFELALSNNPDENVYDPTVDPSVLNEFSSAAFRFGHSMMSATFEMVFKEHEHVFTPMENTFFHPWDLYMKNRFLALVKGLTIQNPWRRSVHFTSALSKKLFKGKEDQFGLDLVSLNIQRGRDHGIPSYNTVRKACGLEFFETFHDLPISSSLKRRLKEVYDDVGDIDLYVGGLFEPSLPGSLLGETFACLIGKQFRALMKGDRYFFTNGHRKYNIRSGHQYTPRQIAEFRKSTLARIFCDNMPLDKIQKRVMEAPAYGIHSRNKPVDCDQIPSPHLDTIILDLH